MADGYNRPNNPNIKPPNVLNEYALRLAGEPINGARRAPLLTVNVKRDGKAGPWCVLFETRTGVENDKDYGKISFLIDIPTMFMILKLILKACDATEATFDRIEIHNRRFMRSQNAWSKEPMLDGTIAVGRTASGQIYIGTKSWDNDRPNCKFVLKPVVDTRRAVKLFHKDGQPWEDGQLSQLYACGWAEGIGKLLSQLYVNEYTPLPPREPGAGWGGNQGGGGGNNRGNWNNNQGGNAGGGQGGWSGQQGGASGGGTTSESSGDAGGWSDDDIPM